MDPPFISIIIPVKGNNPYLEECITHCRKLDYPEYEIMVLPDEEICQEWKDVRVISTGAVGPAEKRDIGMGKSQGEILAFLDDDAFPSQKWLKSAVKYFQNKEIAAVGGPAVTPEKNSLRQKASGLVYSSLLGGGTYVYRYIPKEVREVNDYPTCNLLVRKKILKKLGGFKSLFWPGEDTVLCLNITEKLKKKIVYDPEVLVYHHRRRLFIPHLRQVKNYALHRGYFVKKFPETSFKLSYFLPSIFVSGLAVGGILSITTPSIRSIFLTGVLVYLFLVFLSSLSSKNPILILLVFLGIVLSHLTYGTTFIKGLIIKRLER